MLEGKGDSEFSVTETTTESNLDTPLSVDELSTNIQNRIPGPGKEDESEEEEKKQTIFDILDAPRELPPPEKLSMGHLKQIQNELAILKLCWPVIKDPMFENRVNFPESYLRNSDKEKLLLLYAENFRKQYQRLFPNRKPLFLASDNEVGLQVREKQKIEYFYLIVLKKKENFILVEAV